jgi:hypothetical protein
MPSVRNSEGKLLDARPDRPDLRDRIYQPRLLTPPSTFPNLDHIKQYLTAYTEEYELILDQGEEGACTGFGLAALINYLFFHQAKVREKETGQKVDKIARVSPWMLYSLARRYDEWPGEDYEGSSCRGAMKGWFHHGVCKEDYWPVPPGTSPRKSRRKKGRKSARGAVEPWQADAAERPLGVYYRISVDSISDMQSAIAEVGAIYVSAEVHAGWSAVKKSASLPTIAWPPTKKGDTGGHAFALVGYDETGFIVQNSWGRKWGYLGFARLIYEDWLLHGDDAWVAVMGVPVKGESSNLLLSSTRVVGRLAPNLSRGLANGATAAAAAAPIKGGWSLQESVEHALVIGHRGLPERVTISEATVSEAVEKVVYDRPSEWLASLPAKAAKRIVVYVHGGLNDLDTGIARTSILGPYLQKNGIYPVFAIWQSGLLESVHDIVRSAAESIVPGRRDRGIFDEVMETIADGTDYLIEQVASVPGTAVWNNMKVRCENAAVPDGAVDLLVKGLARLKEQHPNLEIHAIGHSAGSIMIGDMLPLLTRKRLTLDTCSLYAPACTVAFARSTYLKAITAGTLDASSIFIDLLSEKNERDDSVGPYRKSLLYLVSRAFESHKTPILGMEAVWKAKHDGEGIFNDGRGILDPAVVRWRDDWKSAGGLDPFVLSKKEVVTGPQTSQPAGHGCFDNWVDGVSATINRIRREKVGQLLDEPVGSLEYAGG